MSPGDVGRVVQACLTAPEPGFRVIFAISDNTRRWASIDGATALGFVSEDDAESFAPELIARDSGPDPSEPVHDRVGGLSEFGPGGLASCGDSMSYL